jgi:hypothetical protein
VEKNDMEKAMDDMESTLATLNEMANAKFNDAEQKIKKGIVQGVIWILVTAVIYFIWGDRWFFWLSFAISVITIGSMIFAKVMIGKAKKKISKRDEDD